MAIIRLTLLTVISLHSWADAAESFTANTTQPIDTLPRSTTAVLNHHANQLHAQLNQLRGDLPATQRPPTPSTEQSTRNTLTRPMPSKPQIK
jgi:hypothetical protein